jgi:hypothetical protein
MIINKKSFIIVLLLLSSVYAALAVPDAPLRPMNPQIFGQGGSLVATADGWTTLFSNPAGFASKEGTATFYATSFWVYTNPLPLLQAIFNPNASALQNFVDDQMISGGFGFGSMDGFGYVGKNFAAALVINIDAYLWGATVAAAAGELIFNVVFIGGYAYPFQLKDATLTLGFDIRPMLRIQAPIDELVMQDIIGSLSSATNPLATLNGYNTLHGVAIAIDLGAMIKRDGLTWGITIRDFLGTRFSYREDPFGDILVSIRDSFSFPSGGTAVDDHYIPMDISTGFGYTFDFGIRKKGITELVLHWGLSDIFTVVSQKLPPASMLHAGAELELSERFHFRTGFNQGYITFGMGAKVWLLNFNLAYFTREKGNLTTTRPNSGLSLELAVRREGPRDTTRRDRKKREKSSPEPGEE